MEKKIVTTPNVHSKVKYDKLSDDILNKPVDIEELAVDKNAYKVWLKCEENEWLTTKRVYHASDGGLIDLAIVHPFLKKKILHLPQDEQDVIWEMKTDQYQPARLKANMWKKRAFGVIPGPRKEPPGDNKKKQKAYDNAMMAKFAILAPRAPELIELFGRMFTIEEVFTLAVEDWGLPCTRKMLTEFRNHHADVISDKINHHKQSFADLRLGIKKSRLEELCWIYNELKKDYKKNRQVKFAEQLRGVLQDIRKEVEGDRLVVEGNFDVNIEASINQHLQDEILSGIGLRDLIIGRVAVRANISPSQLIYQLTRSYYRKFSGALEPISDAEYVDMKYPNEAGYDFDFINKNQSYLEQEDQKAAQVTEIQVEPSAGEKLRQRLLSIALKNANDAERTQTKYQIAIGAPNIKGN